MASIHNTLFIFAILVSSSVTLAQSPNTNESRSDEVTNHPSRGHDPSEEPPMASSAPGRFHHFKDSKFDFPQFPVAGFFKGDFRQKRSVGRKVINCNYAKEGGFKCTGCHTVRRSYPFNRGTDSTCTGVFHYCNNGQCSRTKGSQCSKATTKSSANTTSAVETTAAAKTTQSTASTASGSSTK